MANFKDAFYKTMGHEGHYSNDRFDAGGETYRGIARKYHPTWAGWKVVDQYKSRNGFPGNLKVAEELVSLVENFYKTNFWNSFSGDQISSQAVAEELFDTGVNMGTPRAVKFFQRSLNALNRNGTIFSDLSEDGKVGRRTINAFNKIAENSNDIDVLLKMMNVLQGMHYMDYMRRSSKQERFARGWFSRVTFGKIYEKPESNESNITNEELERMLILSENALNSVSDIKKTLQNNM